MQKLSKKMLSPTEQEHFLKNAICIPIRKIPKPSIKQSAKQPSDVPSSPDVAVLELRNTESEVCSADDNLLNTKVEDAGEQVESPVGPNFDQLIGDGLIPGTYPAPTVVGILVLPEDEGEGSYLLSVQATAALVCNQDLELLKGYEVLSRTEEEDWEIV